METALSLRQADCLVGFLCISPGGYLLNLGTRLVCGYKSEVRTAAGRHGVTAPQSLYKFFPLLGVRAAVHSV